MDRWQITIEQTRRFDKGDPQPYHIINVREGFFIKIIF